MAIRVKPGNSLQLLFFKVGDEIYCMDMDSVKSVHPPSVMIPDSENLGALGTFTLDRKKFPVFSLASRLGESDSWNETSGRILLIGDEDPWGIMVDSILDVIQVAENYVFPIPAAARNISSDFFKGVIMSKGKMVLYLSSVRLHPDAHPSPPKTSPRPMNTPLKNTSKSTNSGGGGKMLFFSGARSEIGEKRLVFGLSISQILQIIDPLP